MRDKLLLLKYRAGSSSDSLPTTPPRHTDVRKIRQCIKLVDINTIKESHLQFDENNSQNTHVYKIEIPGLDAVSKNSFGVDLKEIYQKKYTNIFIYGQYLEKNYKSTHLESFLESLFDIVLDIKDKFRQSQQYSIKLFYYLLNNTLILELKAQNELTIDEIKYLKDTEISPEHPTTPLITKNSQTPKKIESVTRHAHLDLTVQSVLNRDIVRWYELKYRNQSDIPQNDSSVFSIVSKNVVLYSTHNFVINQETQFFDCDKGALKISEIIFSNFGDSIKTKVPEIQVLVSERVPMILLGVNEDLSESEINSIMNMPIQFEQLTIPEGITEIHNKKESKLRLVDMTSNIAYLSTQFPPSEQTDQVLEFTYKGGTVTTYELEGKQLKTTCPMLGIKKHVLVSLNLPTHVNIKPLYIEPIVQGVSSQIGQCKLLNLSILNTYKKDDEFIKLRKSVTNDITNTIDYIHANLGHKVMRYNECIEINSVNPYQLSFHVTFHVGTF